ncbi:MAG: ROK family protein [Bacteroidota bacterium]
MNQKYAVGSDIGGSHITCALIDLEHQMILPESRVKCRLNNKASADEILGVWSEAVGETILGIDLGDLAGIGFAMPGPFDYVNGIALFKLVDKYLGLYGVNVTEGIKKKLGLSPKLPFRYMNDASAFAVGEAWMGVAAEVRKSVAITLGTGFGSAFIDNGIPVVDRDDVPKKGCVWHLPVQDSIADDYFSTRWYQKKYTELTGKTQPGVKEIAQEARQDPKIAALFTEYGTNSGAFLGEWLNRFGAEVLVIGGNMAREADLFMPAFEKSLAKLNCKTRIAWSELKEDAAIIGSARLLDTTYWSRIETLIGKMN